MLVALFIRNSLFDKKPRGFRMNSPHDNNFYISKVPATTTSTVELERQTHSFFPKCLLNENIIFYFLFRKKTTFLCSTERQLSAREALKWEEVVIVRPNDDIRKLFIFIVDLRLESDEKFFFLSFFY